eukprot:TRINITY_DN14566_c0_g1_i1.p1 TRINITY_DN14566_c0_g1~~TRINITY_DN14566_c0_g1_i1.p1  ORF type:complete len:140 (-),score=3.96 TRINITY_DN14566_c0_g1_i1:12-431(-)
MPILHSIIHVEDEVARIEAMVSQPRLLLNGIPLRTSELSDGDLITIGPIEFVFCQSRPHTATSISTAGLSGSPLQTSAPITPKTVSYTHLRAHETVLDLVCRLLLEKKKNQTICNNCYIIICNIKQQNRSHIMIIEYII